MGQTNGSPAVPPDAELSLRVFPEDDALVWEATNAGDSTVLLWEQGNSWGWPMPRLYLAAEPDSTTPDCLSPAARVWTRNFPSNLELPPQESARYVLRAGDFDPATREGVRQLWQHPLWVRAELRCEGSAEAVEYGVWCGTLRGAEQQLAPPHAWLRPDEA